MLHIVKLRRRKADTPPGVPTAKQLDDARWMHEEDRRHLYSETVKVTSVFLDWRHKVMSFTLTVVAASVAIGGWMYDHDLREAMAVPAFLAGLMALAAAVFDARNQDILYKNYRVGGALEAALRFPEGGPLASIPKTGLKRLFTYHIWLRGFYLLLAISSLGAGIWLATDPPSPPPKVAQAAQRQ